MPAPYRYAVLRVVPRVDRDEFINAGIIVFSPERRFLKARFQLGEERLRALWPSLDLDLVRRHLEAVMRICDGDRTAGPIAHMTQRERFHWLTAPRSTIVQISAVKTGLSDTLDATLDDLLFKLVA